MASKITHFAFSASAAADIRQALKILGRDDIVPKFFDDLSCGPINPLDSLTRSSWFEENLGFESAEWNVNESFWLEDIESASIRIAWVSRRCASEYCGFLEYVWQLGERPSLIIETTQAKRPDGSFFSGTAVIPADQIVSRKLLDTAQDLSPDLRAGGRMLWDQLRKENASLRTLDQNLHLKSVPLSYYDDMLLSLVKADWTPMARVVGEALVTIWDTEVSTASDWLLFSRLYALIDAGLVEERASTRRYPDIRSVGT
jgi:hypothetical protein